MTLLKAPTTAFQRPIASAFQRRAERNLPALPATLHHRNSIHNERASIKFLVRRPVLNTPLLLPVGALVVAMISFQLGASIAKRLFPVLGAEGTAALRLGFAALILIGVLRPWRARLNARNWRSVTVYGIALGCMNLMFYLALNRIALGIAVALEFTGPLAVATIASRRAIDFAWIALAVTGLLLLLPSSGSATTLDLTGVVFALGAGFCWALYIIFGQRAGADHGTQATVFGTMIAAIVVLPIGVSHLGSALLSPAVVSLALAVAVLSSALPYTLEMFALGRLPAQSFGTLMSIEPAIAALTGFTFLHETLLPLQWLAIGTIVCASIGTSLTTKPKAVTPLPE